MANHPYNQHREQQVAHRRVNTILSGSPSGSASKMSGGAYSKVTSKTAAMSHDDIGGKASSNKYARGGKVHKGHQTNIAIVMPKGGAPGGAPMPGGPPMPGGAPMAMPPKPMGPPMGGPPMGGGMPGLPPGGPPPGMPMHASGGRIKGEATKANIGAMAKRAKANSFMRGGAATGVGREEKAASAKKK